MVGDDADHTNVEEAAPPFALRAQSNIGRGAAPVRVLLVDDNEDVRILFRVGLEIDPAFEVVGEAADGQKALDALSSGCPDAIVLDQMMPVMDGLSALPRLLQHCPSARVVMVTAAATPQLEHEALGLGAYAVLDKGASIDELKTILSADPR